MMVVMVVTLTDDGCTRFITRTPQSPRAATGSHHHRRTQRCASRWCINIPAGINSSRQHHARTAKAADARVSTRKWCLTAKNATSVVDGRFREFDGLCDLTTLTRLDMPLRPLHASWPTNYEIDIRSNRVLAMTFFLTRVLRERV